VTPFVINFSLDGWELFKVIMDKSKIILKAMKALSGNTENAMAGINYHMQILVLI
jgi:hypothetical protein